MKKARRFLSLTAAIFVALLATVAAVQGAHPTMIRYQARLTDDAGLPLLGTRDLVFTIYDAESGGSVLWSESVSTVLENGVVDIVLGGTGPLPASVFAGGDCWLEATVDSNVLAPRQRLVSVPFAHSSDLVDGLESTQLLRSDTSNAFTSGTLTFNAGTTLDAAGTLKGAAFQDRDNPTFYVDPASTSYFNFVQATTITDRDNPVYQLDPSGVSYTNDVQANIFHDRNDPLFYVDPALTSNLNDVVAATFSGDGSGLTGVTAADSGTVDGLDSAQFLRSDTGDSFTSGTLTIDTGTTLDVAGTLNANSLLDRADPTYLVDPATTTTSARFAGDVKIGQRYSSDNDFLYFDVEGELEYMAWFNVNDRFEFSAGGYFVDDLASASALVGSGDTGLEGYGDTRGVYAQDLDQGTTAWLASGASSTGGSGTKNFVQNHPHDPALMIQYSSLEGDEVGTYTRGSARLVAGEARVVLGETFQWVTNPDVGLTVHLTPRGGWADLYVESVSTTELIVRSPDATAEVAFDYLVSGLRIGFEEVGVVRERDGQAHIPSMVAERELYDRLPELRRFSALGRFGAMRAALGETGPLDLSAAQTLRDAIVEFDPAVHGRPRPAHPGPELVRPESPAAGDTASASAGQPSPETERPEAATEPGTPARSLLAQQPLPSDVFPVGRPVTAGDVLVVDPERPGALKPGETASDPSVVGIALADARGSGSGEPARDDDTPGVELAVSGIVVCRVDAAYGAVRPGDLLTTSPTPGHAMRVDDPRPGTVVAKALEPLDEGRGVIRVVVMLR